MASRYDRLPEPVLDLYLDLRRKVIREVWDQWEATEVDDLSDLLSNVLLVMDEAFLEERDDF